MPYEQRYVAFVDVLGFSDLVRATARSSSEYDSLVSILRKMRTRDELTKDFDELVGDDFRFQQFSDSIVMSDRESETGLLHLLVSVQELAIELLKSGKLIRGGIAKGQLHHEDELMFGPAFIEAYRLESGVAKYPRVLLSRDVFADLRQYNLSRLCKLSEDGPAYVHLLADLNLLPPGTASDCHDRLEAELERAMHEPAHFEKVKWFAIYWNSSIPAGTSGRLRQVRFPYQVESSGLAWDDRGR